MGDLMINLLGKIKHSDIRIILYDGIIKGSLNTTLGSLSFVLYVDYTNDVIRLSLNTTRNEKCLKMLFNYNDTSIVYNEIEKGIKNVESSDFNYYLFKLKTGEEYSVIYNGNNVENNNEYYITISEITNNDNRKNNESLINDGIEKLRKYIKENKDNSLYKLHKEFWNNLYKKSYLSMSDKRLEGLYWIELYKIGCTMKCRSSNCSLLDDMGVWYVSDKKQNIEINYKIILKYLPLLLTNNDELLFDSLINIISNNKDQFIQSVPVAEYQKDSMCLNKEVNWFLESKCNRNNNNNCSVADSLGNLNLISFLLWKYYQYTLNSTYLEDILYPILTKSTNYYIHFVDVKRYNDIKEENNKDNEKLIFSNRDISLLKWSCNAILEISSILNRNDEITTKCDNLLSNLSNFTIDSNNNNNDRYRYNSVDDLFMFFPLNLINHEEESEENQMIIRNTINHFINKDMNDVSSSIIIFSSLLSQYLPEQKNNSMKLLLQFINSSKVGLSTMTLDENNEPDISSSLGFIVALRNMIVYSDNSNNGNNVVKIFPIRVNETKSVTFKNYKVENGFVISGEMREYAIQWINIKSTLINGNITIEVDSLCDIDYTPKNVKINKIETNRFLIYLKINESVSIYPNGTTPEIVVHYVSDNKRQFNYWGTKNKPFPIPDFPDIEDKPSEEEEEEFDSSIYSVCIIFTLTGSTLIYVSISMRRNSRLRKKYTTIPDE